MKTIKVIAAVILAGLGVILLAFVAHVSWLLYDGLTDEPFTAHVAVVMGNAVDAPGKPSPRLKSRLDKAYQLYLDRRVQRILVSGGVDDKSLQEGLEMGRYLVRRGIPKEMIWVDDLGDNTYRTASNAQMIMSPYRQFRSVVVVSNYYHILRSKLAFTNCGTLAVYGAHANHFEWRDVWWSIPREVLGFYAYMFKDCPAPERY